MSMNSVIQQRRKLLGLTQEQVADYLGVTTPAVSKWESGSTCPDIGLLPPLARLLKIDLNTLFGFYEEITQQELIRFCKEINEAVMREGIDAGFAMAQEKIQEFPNSDNLLHNIALQLQGLLTTSGIDGEQIEKHMGTITEWYERLAGSEEAAIRNSVCFMLASHAINEGNCETAQSYLDRMPNRNDTPDKRMLQASIWMKQDRSEDAAKWMEQALIGAVGDLQMILYKLIDANLAAGEHTRAEYAAQRLEGFAELFDLNPYNAAVASFQIATEYRDADRTITSLRAMLDALSAEWRLQNSPLYRRVKTTETGETMRRLIGPLLEELEQSPDYSYLRENEGFKELLVDYKKELK